MCADPHIITSSSTLPRTVTDRLTSGAVDGKRNALWRLFFPLVPQSATRRSQFFKNASVFSGSGRCSICCTNHSFGIRTLSLYRSVVMATTCRAIQLVCVHYLFIFNTFPNTLFCCLDVSGGCFHIGNCCYSNRKSKFFHC